DPFAWDASSPPLCSGSQASVRVCASERVVRHVMAKRRIAVPERTPRAPTETATLSAWEAPTPEAISVAAPVPACAAAPAGPIGRSAPPAPPQRRRNAGGDETVTPLV